MPRDPNKKRVEAHMTQEDYSAFRAVASAPKRDWSDKRLSEAIISAFLKLDDKEAFLSGDFTGPDLSTKELKWLKEKVALLEKISALQSENEQLKTRIK